MGGSWPNNAGQAGGSGGGGGGGPTVPIAGGVGSGDPFPGTIGALHQMDGEMMVESAQLMVQQGGGGGGAGAVGNTNSPSNPTYGLGLEYGTFRNPLSTPVGADGGGVGTPGCWRLVSWSGGNGGGYSPGVNPAVASTRPAGGGGYGVTTGAPYNVRGGSGVTNTGGGGGGASTDSPGGGRSGAVVPASSSSHILHKTPSNFI
jgi:hypothetical protein